MNPHWTVQRDEERAMAEEHAENQISEGSRRPQESAEAQGIEPETVLVEIQPGIALVFGDGVPEGFDELVGCWFA